MSVTGMEEEKKNVIPVQFPKRELATTNQASLTPMDTKDNVVGLVAASTMTMMTPTNKFRYKEFPMTVDDNLMLPPEYRLQQLFIDLISGKGRWTEIECVPADAPDEVDCSHGFC